MTALLTPLVGAAALGGWAMSHARRRRGMTSIPLRILVGGTRGKTTTTRLLAEALRAAGQRTAARVTGREPQALGTDGRWRRMAREGEPNPDELRRWLDALARSSPPGAVVVENCGVSPETIWAIGRHMVSPTLCVLTDCVPDHLDRWPSDPVQIARIHLSAAPPEAEILTPDPIIRAEAERQGRAVIPLLDAACDDALPPWMRSHAVCALTACWWMLGEHTPALAGRVAREALRLLPEAVALPSGGWFLDLFDANDPRSAASSLSSLRTLPPVERRVALFADRPDRAWRLRQFEPWMRAAFQEIWILGAAEVAPLTRALQGLGPNTLVVGLGNALGPAQGLLASLGVQRRLA